MPIYSEPGEAFEATIDNAPTGLVGTIGVAVLETPGVTEDTPRTTAGIVENPAGSGIYSVELTAPATTGTYSVVWDTGGGSPTYASEDLFVVDTVGVVTVPVSPGGSGGIAMSLEELRQEVLDHEFDEFRYSDYVDKMLNRCQMVLAEKIDFKEFSATSTITTVADTAGYGLPGDYMRLDSVWNLTDNIPLRQLTASEYNNLASASRGKPTSYVTSGTSIFLYPTPDAEYTVSMFYCRYPLVMTDDTDTPEIPLAGEQLLVRYALARCFERENDTNQARYHWDAYQQEMIYFMGSIDSDDDDNAQPRQVEGMWNTPIGDHGVAGGSDSDGDVILFP